MFQVFSRLQNLILLPQETWAEIEHETVTASEVLQYYVSKLALVPAGAGFLGWLFSGENFFQSLLWGALCYGFSLLAVWLSAGFLRFIAPTFEIELTEDLAVSLAGFSFSPVFAAGVFLILPGFSFLLLLGFYGLFIFYLGVERFIEIPAEKFTPFLLTTSLGMGVIYLMALGLAMRFSAMPSLLP